MKTFLLALDAHDDGCVRLKHVRLHKDSLIKNGYT
jgi:hypothetical protein